MWSIRKIIVVLVVFILAIILFLKEFPPVLYHNLDGKVANFFCLNKVKKLKLDFSNKTVLDFGCGTGINNNIFSKNCNYIGTDVAGGRIDYARKLYPHRKFVSIDLINQDNPQMPFKDKTFDYVAIFNCLHHIPENDIHYIAKDIHRILKPNGQVIMVEPCNSSNPVTTFVANFYDGGDYIRHHNEYIKLFEPGFNTKYKQIETSYGLVTHCTAVLGKTQNNQITKYPNKIRSIRKITRFLIEKIIPIVVLYFLYHYLFKN